jgi:hypothetical protein
MCKDEKEKMMPVPPIQAGDLYLEESKVCYSCLALIIKLKDLVEKIKS